MKNLTLLSTAVIAIVALALTAPLVAQTASGPGLGIQWQIALSGDTARNSGTAQYDSFRATATPPATVGKVFTKFSVETHTPEVADGGVLDVFLGPGSSPREPYGKLVGTIEVNGGNGAMILIAAKTPTIEKGSTVTVTSHQSTAAGDVLLKGTF